MKRFMKWFALVFAALVVVIIIAIVVTPTPESTAPVAETTPVSVIGQVGTLDTGTDATWVPLSVELENMSLLGRTLQASDLEGLAGMVDRGWVLIVVRGVEVKIIYESDGLAHVRILEGSHIGLSGWVPMEWVSR